MDIILQFAYREIATARFSRYKSRGHLLGGTVRREEAERGWIRCRYLGGALRIIDGHTFYALFEHPLVPASPGANFGSYGPGYELRVSDVTDGLPGKSVFRRHFEGHDAKGAYETQCCIEFDAGRRLYPNA